MLCNLHCLKSRLRLLCNKYQQHSSLNLVSQQLKLCNIFIFGMAYYEYIICFEKYSDFAILRRLLRILRNLLLLIFSRYLNISQNKPYILILQITCFKTIYIMSKFFKGKSETATAGEFELMSTNTEVHKIVRISKTNQDNPNL